MHDDDEDDEAAPMESEDKGDEDDYSAEVSDMEAILKLLKKMRWKRKPQRINCQIQSFGVCSSLERSVPYRSIQCGCRV